MRITIISPRIFRKTFSGGIYCNLKHANELVARGHDVTVIAYPKSVPPKWIDLKAKLVIPSRFQWDATLPLIKRLVASASLALNYSCHDYQGSDFKQPLINKLLPPLIPDSDVTIATFWETAELVARHGKGGKAYLCQHYEPLFYEDPVDSLKVETTYSYGLKMIANSSWLKSKIERTLRSRGDESLVQLALNAIDPDVFLRPTNSLPKDTAALRLISYGGRDAIWKGFLDMAQAVRIARESLPGKNIEWSVYGDSLLQPENEIASYTALGFLDPLQLADAYRQHHALLSASWYESYPLFPIEAMASGLAVITTEAGTEDYAIDQENCLIVEPRNVKSIAEAIIRLANDRELVRRLGENASSVAIKHNWGLAGARMEATLKCIATTP